SKVGSGYLDYGDTPAFPGVFEASSYSAGSTLRGLDMVMKSEIDHAFNPMGGLHHARRDRAGGFCVFNDAALAIVRAKQHYHVKKVLYVDIDVHHGDGVFYELYDDPAVFIADIHENGKFLYPGTGFEFETGEGEAKGTKLNLPLAPGSGDKEFKEAFDQVIRFAQVAKPDLIVMQTGADGLKDDPLAHLQYSEEAHRYASSFLHTFAHSCCGGKIIAMGGGGYVVENCSRAWMAVVKAFVGI
ncbi:MAG: acetoin utilization protein AcuC, partial [Thaumarchaeota archaeon]|nr:acetoin utilization protein AcuC [Nitrososphaerota archaeon]